MKRLLSYGCAAFVCSFAPAAQATPLIPRDLSALGRFEHALVQLAERDRVAGAQLRRAGGTPVSKRLRIWRLPSRAAQRLVPGLAVAGTITEVEPDRPREAFTHGEGGDPLLPLQWWLARVGADRVEPPGPGKPVTVIDSGLDVSHPEFVGRQNTALLNAQSLTGQREFHGTAVASVVAAPANGIGVVGIYPQAVLNSWDASPSGNLSTSAVIAGIEAAAGLGPGVINLSLGGPGRSSFEAQVVSDAFARGAILVAAVGNDRERGSPLSFPASYPHVLTVAATDAGDRHSLFSSAAPGIDVAAPGEAIPVALPAAFAPSGFGSVSGTSFSAPIVAGAVAWIWTARPDLEKTQVIELVRRSARDLAPAGRDGDTGFGLLDVPRALSAPAPPVDPFEPNDDLEQAGDSPLLTRPGRGRARISGRVDPVDDPRDVHRVFVPARSRLTVVLRAARAVELAVQGRRPSAVTLVRRSPHTLTLTNNGRSGASMAVSVFKPLGGSFAGASYTLNVSTARVPH